MLLLQVPKKNTSILLFGWSLKKALLTWMSQMQNICISSDIVEQLNLGRFIVFWAGGSTTLGGSKFSSAGKNKVRKKTGIILFYSFYFGQR